MFKKTLRMLARTASALALLVIALGAAGCSSPLSQGGSADADAAQGTVNTALVLGSNASAGRATFSTVPESLVELLAETLDSGGSLGIATVEGDPRTAYAMTALGDTQATDAGVRSKRNGQTAASVAQVLAHADGTDEETLATLESQSAEADVYGAVGLAARDLAAARTEGSESHLVILDSLVGTAGLIDFSGATGMALTSDPDDVLAYLEAEDALCDLSGVHVTVYFAGDVAYPQEDLSSADTANLKDIWETVLLGCGAADVSFAEDAPQAFANEDEYLAGLPAVTSAPVSEPAAFAASSVAVGETFALGVAESITFEPNTAEFRDEAAARATIEALAGELERAGAVVALEGNTSTDARATDEQQRTLSRERARRVADLLVEAGLPAESIASVTGNGANDGTYYKHETDVDSSGCSILDAAQRNRCVVVAVTSLAGEVKG